MQIRASAPSPSVLPAATPAAAQPASCPLPDSFERVDPSYELNAQNQVSLQQSLAQLKSAAARPYYDAQADAAARARYYKGIPEQLQNLNPQDTYRILSTLVTASHSNKLDYNPSGNLYPWVDLHPDLKLHSIYSQQSFSPSEAIKADLQNMQQAMEKLASSGPMPASAESLGAALALHGSGAALNCEHVVPQSWFEKHNPMRGDLHHLFACEPGCNSARGSRMFFEARGNDHIDLPGCGRTSQDDSYFEPVGGKGAVARATLYFILRYPGEVGDEHGEYQAADIQTLLKWHREYPPDLYEKHRNASIEWMQGNRNPLIDFPELAERIDFTQGLGRA